MLFTILRELACFVSELIKERVLEEASQRRDESSSFFTKSLMQNEY